jgi:dihydroxyacetone kinase
MVVVSDDVALPDSAQPRGIAGTLFVHKIAGHLAESGHALGTVKQGAQDAAGAIRSLGVSFSTCTVPGQKPESRLGEREAELGMGIHGEPGASVIEAGSVRQIVELMVARLCESKTRDDRRFGLLVNNLGGVPPMEMGVIVNEVMTSRLGQRIELMFGPAPLMTSLDMNGFSLSLIALNADRRKALLAPVVPRAWVPGVRVEPITLMPLPPFAHANQFQGSANKRAAAVVRSVCDVLIEKQAELNGLDAKVGDGDTGSTFATAARSVADKLNAAELPLAEPDRLCLAIGDLLGKTMGGSSGVLMSILFTAAGVEMGRTNNWSAALEKGIQAVRHYGGAKGGDRTMLDALIPAVAALKCGGISAAADAGQRGADATAMMTKAHAGRSSYVNATNLHGVKDPGAAAVAFAFQAVARATQSGRVEDLA